MDEINKQDNQNKSSLKDELVLNIKEWIKMDSEINKLKTQLKFKTKEKKTLTNELLNVMKRNSIDCFNTNGGKLIYKCNKSRETISKKFLLTQLEKYYKEQPETAKELTQFILDNRTEIIKDDIKLKVK